MKTPQRILFVVFAALCCSAVANARKTLSEHAVQQAAGWKVLKDTDIAGSDIPCNPTATEKACKTCPGDGAVQSVIYTCMDTEGCLAFVWDAKSKCATLKGSDSGTKSSKGLEVHTPAEAKSPAAVPAGWKRMENKGIAGQDIRCQSSAFQTWCNSCPQSGNVADALDTCKRTQGCVAIVWNAKTKCATLKGSASSVKDSKGLDIYSPEAFKAPAAAAAPAAPAGWKRLEGKDIAGQDIRCQASAPETMCQSCPPSGKVADALDTCKRTQGCVAIVWDAKAKCATLKGSASSVKDSNGLDVYASEASKAPAAAAPAAPAGWKRLEGKDIPGQDIRCQASAPETMCQICPPSGLVAGIADACKRTQGCVAFTWDPKAKCGWLKGAAGSTSDRSGWDVYAPSG